MFVLYQSCKIPVIDYIGTMFERNPRAGIGLGGNCELRGVSSPCCASSSTLHLVGEVTGQEICLVRVHISVSHYRFKDGNLDRLINHSPTASNYSTDNFL